MSKELVLVTGFSGYIGTECALKLLEQGYRVRGAVRNESKAKPYLEAYPQYRDQLEWAYVPDIGTPGAFEEAVRGVQYVIHTASPLADKITDAESDMLLPAINGTLGVLCAANKAGGIKRVVITSSFGAMEDYGEPWNPDHVYTEDDWCPIPYERAKRETADMGLIYCCAKKEAEKAAWKYMEDVKPDFELSVAIPTTVFGPTRQPVKTPADLPLSCKRIAEFFDAKEIPVAPVAPPCVDISDMAECHLKALFLPEAVGKRYLCGTEGHSPAGIAATLRQAFPEEAHRIPYAEDKGWGDVFKWDGSKAVKELGIKFTPIQQSIIGAGKQFLELEKQSKA